MTADDVITALALAPHPEGGHYRQTWVAEARADERPAGTCIYFLLRACEESRWHRVDAAEVWHFYAGAPLVLSLTPTLEGPAEERRLGPDLASGEAPQMIVPEGWWQAARTTGPWTLAGCTVSPGFRFEGFELAPPGLDVPRRASP